MSEIIQQLRQILIENPILVTDDLTFNPLQLISAIAIFAVFLLINRLMRRGLSRIGERFEVDKKITAKIITIISLIVIAIGLAAGLELIGVRFASIVGTVLTFSIPIGQTDLGLVKIFWFVTVIIGSTTLSRYVRKILQDRVLPPFDLPRNAQFLLLRFIHIVFLGFGILIALNLTGLSLTSFTAILGGLSIGLGFGLQNIASNLISGVILIFERPVRVGDRITVGETFGTIIAINVRSTLIKTLDNIDIIVPNSQLISETIINWTHRDTQIRIQIPVGVAYGSDTELVKQVLLEVASDHPKVIDAPDQNYSSLVREPIVRFLNFGDSSLDFELQVWILDLRDRAEIVSDLHFIIDRKFRENEIEIPFPQTDLHIREIASEIRSSIMS